MACKTKVASDSVTRIPILDGWRAVSILLVLAGHLFPMGPGSWKMNGAVAASGMALFFTLSGFLITQFLLNKADVIDFLLRRFFRILPLAWLAMLALAVATQPEPKLLFLNLLFVSNLGENQLLHGGEHLWSLCVEMQFYVGVAILVALAGRRALYVLPLLCLFITGLRVGAGAEISIVTWHRVDEILAGATLALIYSHAGLGERLKRLPAFATLLFVPLLLASAHEWAGPLNYLRPYFAACAIGASIFSAPLLMQRLFSSKPAVYIAETSYALYVFHAMFAATWLGSGDKLVKYAKRPLLLAATFGAAHLSTFWLERPMQKVGKKIGDARGRAVRPA